MRVTKCPPTDTNSLLLFSAPVRDVHIHSSPATADDGSDHREQARAEVRRWRSSSAWIRVISAATAACDAHPVWTRSGIPLVNLIR